MFVPSSHEAMRQGQQLLRRLVAGSMFIEEFDRELERLELTLVDLCNDVDAASAIRREAEVAPGERTCSVESAQASAGARTFARRCAR